MVLAFASHFLIFIWNMIVLWREKLCCFQIHQMNEGLLSKCQYLWGETSYIKDIGSLKFLYLPHIIASRHKNFKYLMPWSRDSIREFVLSKNTEIWLATLYICQINLIHSPEFGWPRLGHIFYRIIYLASPKWHVLSMHEVQACLTIKPLPVPFSFSYHSEWNSLKNLI